MRKGKIAAQVAHASMKVFFDRMTFISDDKAVISNITEPMKKWANFGPFTKIVVGCDSEEELLAIQQKAIDNGVPNALIVDAGNTEFHGVPTRTCVAIGPDEEDKINLITGELKLL